MYQLPTGWIWTTLEKCIEILDSQRIPINAEEREKRIAGKATSELYPYYGATGQVGWIDDYLFDEELILLGEDGAPFFESAKNKAYLIKGKSWVNNHAHVLKAISGVTLNQFLYHYLNIFDYHGYVTGTTRSKLNQSPMRKIPVPLPPLPEQRRIVAKIEELFTKLDAGVLALKKTQAQLKRYRQSVLKTACEGKLVPTEAELAKKERRTYEPADMLLARILKERRGAWETHRKDAKGAKYKEPAAPDTSGLPALLEGWCRARFEQTVSISQNGFGKRRSNEGNPTIVLRLADILDGEISLSNVRRIGATNSEIEKYRLLNSDLLCIRVNGSRNLVGRMIIYKSALEPVTFCDHFIRFRLLEPTTALFLSKYFDTEEVRKYVEFNMVSSAGQNTVSQSTMMAIPVPLPPLAEQRRIVFEVERRLSVADEVARTVELSIVQAQRLRQSILKKAFEGKLVAQDASDEPAGVLLERIRQQKQLNNQTNRTTRRRAHGNISRRVV